MKASKANAIINKYTNGLFISSMMKRKGWSKLEARSYVVEWATSGSKESIYDFMNSK